MTTVSLLFCPLRNIWEGLAGPLNAAHRVTSGGSRQVAFPVELESLGFVTAIRYQAGRRKQPTWPRCGT